MPDRSADVIRNRPVLTDKARREIGLHVDDRTAEVVMVPLVSLPMRDDTKDRR